MVSLWYFNLTFAVCVNVPVTGLRGGVCIHLKRQDCSETNNRILLVSLNGTSKHTQARRKRHPLEFECHISLISSFFREKAFWFHIRNRRSFFPSSWDIPNSILWFGFGPQSCSVNYHIFSANLIYQVYCIFYHVYRWMETNCDDLLTRYIFHWVGVHAFTNYTEVSDKCDFHLPRISDPYVSCWAYECTLGNGRSRVGFNAIFDGVKPIQIPVYCCDNNVSEPHAKRT